jgi:hypothetical protein
VNSLHVEGKFLIEAIELLNPLKINQFDGTYVFIGEREEILFIPEKFMYVRNEKKKYCKNCYVKELYGKGATFSMALIIYLSRSEVLKREINENLYIAHYPVNLERKFPRKLFLVY